MTIASYNNIAAIGVVKDIQAENLPSDDKNGVAWTEVQNVRFKGTSISKMPGYSTLIDTSTTVAPYFLQRIQNGSNSYYVYAGLNKIYCFFSGTHYNLTRQTTGTDVNYSASTNNLWTGTAINGFPVFNNGVDVPQSWATVNQSTRLTNLAAWKSGYTCNVLRAFKAYLVAGDVSSATTRFGSRVMWSGAALPGALPTTWDETDTTNDAGYQDLSDSEGYIIDMLSLGDNNIIYKNTSTYVMSYVGGSKIFAIRKTFPNIGLFSKNCVAPVNAQHFMVTNDDVVMHDGFQYQSVIDNKNRRWLFNNINQTNYQKTFVVPNYARSEMWICFPAGSATYPNTTLIYNYAEGTWTKRTFPIETPWISCGFIDLPSGGTIDSYTSAFNTGGVTTFDYTSYPKSVWSLMMVIPSTSKIAQLDAGTNLDNGSPMTALVERQNLILGDDQTIKTIRRVWLKTTLASGSANSLMNVYVGTQMYKNAGITWQGPYQFDMARDNKVDFIATGRYLSIRFLTNTDCDWSIENFDIDYTERGKW